MTATHDGWTEYRAGGDRDEFETQGVPRQADGTLYGAGIAPRPPTGQAPVARPGGGAEPPRGAPAPTGAGTGPKRPRLIGLRDNPLRQWLAYSVLFVMAIADAVGFWLTLSQIILNHANLVLYFVVALSLGAVAAPAQAGRLMRSRREGYGGSLAWVVLLNALWLALGTAIAYVRWHTPLKGTPAQRSGVLSSTLAKAAANSGGKEAAYVAVLLLVLYLLTGTLAMTHGYRHGDPRTPEMKAAIRARAEVERELAERRKAVEQAQGQINTVRAGLRRVEQSRRRAHEADEYQYDLLRSQARNEIAAVVKDPSATQILHEDWPDSGPPRRPSPNDPYPEI